MMKLAFAAASSFLMVASIPFGASADDVLSPDRPAQATRADSQEDVEWIYVGCAAYPVSTETESDESMAAQQSKSMITLANRSVLPENRPHALTD